MTNDTTPAPIGADVLRERLLAAAPKAEPSTNLADEFTKELDQLSQRNYELRMENATLRAQAAPAAVAGPLDKLEELSLLNRLIELGAKAAHAHAKSNSDDGHAGTKAYVQRQELRAEMGELIRATYATPTTQVAPQPAVQQGAPVAWRSWDSENSRWNFTLWPDEWAGHADVWEPLYTYPAAPVAHGDARAEQALLKVLAAVQRYLPPDGPSAKDTLSEIIGIVDPWPLGDLKGKA